ncbi:MAG: DUF4159 domain-containing protein [Alphaproteobacteria bacterium]|nr:DUF4159 domain-containing protein [Alphaproteobacteria bacterium]
MKPVKFKHVMAGMLLAAFAAVAPATAQDATVQSPAISSQDEQLAVQLSSAPHLGYVTGPSAAVNGEVRLGLETLVWEMQRRLNPPAGVVAVNIEQDDLTLLPFIYFPVTAETQPLSQQAQRKLQSYIDNNGFLLIDTRDYGAVVNEPRDLSRILGSLNMRPLVPLPQDHVLMSSFYLVSNVPGTVPGGTVWVEQPGPANGEVVTSVIIGGRNWAGAWAGTTVAPNSRDREMAIRAGANMVMHALYGNYKSDQLHTPAILDRMQP